MDWPCLAQISANGRGHARYCQLIDPASPIYNPGYIAVLAADPDCPETPTPPATSAVPLAETLGLISRMKKCEHWEASSSCGCGSNRCLAGKGSPQGIVSHQQCFECLCGNSPTSPLASLVGP